MRRFTGSRFFDVKGSVGSYAEIERAIDRSKALIAVVIPVKYGDDFARAEQILFEAARHHAVTREKIGDEEVKRLEGEFGIGVGDIDPQTYWRITDNWLEITVRFLAPDHGIRAIKDKMSRDILAGLQEAKIGIASGTYAIVEVPPIRIERGPG